MQAGKAQAVSRWAVGPGEGSSFLPEVDFLLCPLHLLGWGVPSSNSSKLNTLTGLLAAQRHPEQQQEDAPQAYQGTQ